MGLVIEHPRSRSAMCGVMALLVGCGGIAENDKTRYRPDVDTSVASGSRLVVPTWRYGDLALPPVPATIFDTELGVGCDFDIASDGVERCLPSSQHDIAVDFLEPSCESPVASLWERCENNGYVVASKERSACGSGGESSVYEVGRVIETPSVLYERVDGTCRASSRGPRAYPYYELELVPPSRFVAGERVVVPKTSSLGIEIVLGRDGMRLPLSVYDLERDRVCTFQRIDEDGPSELHCLGPTARAGRAFKDAECSETAATFDTYLDCEPPELILRSAPFCSTHALFERADEVSSAWRLSGDGACVEEDSTGVRFYALGEATRGDAYARVEETVIGSGRLASHGYVQNGVPLLPQGFWDSLLEQSCSPRRAADGKTYCVPLDLRDLFYSFDYYADDACSDPLQTETIWECSGPPASFVGQSTSLVECAEPEIESLYEALAFEGETVHALTLDGRCVSMPSNPSLRYFRIGAPLEPADVFVELKNE